MTKTHLKKISKIYPNWYKKIRRAIFNLYRPILHGKWDSIFNQSLIVYVILILLVWSGILVWIDNPNYAYPFLSGWGLVFITMFYSRFFPLTWDEMYEYEKVAFRILNKLPQKWVPSTLQFGSEGAVNGKKHSTK